jgi:hypothetical protein
MFHRIDSSLPAIKPDEDVMPGREGLWSKTSAAFKYIYKNYKGDFDWVLKADDDT